MLVMDDNAINEFFGKEGKLSKAIPFFENRREQLTMALAVARSLQKGGHIMVEAGTGTGKSLA